MMRFSPRPARLALDVLEARDVPTALLQIINDSPYEAARSLDVYVNGVKQFDDLVYRQSTPFVTVPDGVALRIDLVAGTAANNAAPLRTQTVTLPANGKAVAAIVGVATGVAGPEPVNLVIASNARAAAEVPQNVDLLVLNGFPDAGPIDVKIRGVGTVVNDVPTASFHGGYVSVTPGRYVFDVTRQDGVAPVGSFLADLTGAAGKALVLATSGFGATAATTDAGYGLLAVDATGTGALLPRTAAFAETAFAAGGTNSATLFEPDGRVRFTVTPFGAAAGTGPTVRTATGDVNGDGVTDLIVGSGPGVTNRVVVYDGKTQGVVRDFMPFEATFNGGVFVAAADVNGDLTSDIVITPDQSGGARVQLRSGRDNSQLVGDFFGIDDPAFRGGARAGFADLNADGTPDLIVGAGFGGGPRVAAFNGLSLLPGGSPSRLFADFFVFEPGLRNGAFVAGGDMNGDGFDDLVAGGGPGGGPRVYALSGKALTGSGVAAGTQTPVANFFAGDVNNRDGVRVAVKDLDGDYRADIVTGLGSAGTPQVRTFLGKNLAAPTPTATTDLNPFNAPPAGGVFVG